MLPDKFSLRHFEESDDSQLLCRHLASELTTRLRGASDTFMESEWIIADLRALGHRVLRRDDVIQDWMRLASSRLRLVLRGLGDEAAAITVDVAYHANQIYLERMCCVYCESALTETEISLEIEGLGDSGSPGVLISFEAPGVAPVNEVVRSQTIRRHRIVHECKQCGAGILFPDQRSESA